MSKVTSSVSQHKTNPVFFILTQQGIYSLIHNNLQILILLNVFQERTEDKKKVVQMAVGKLVTFRNATINKAFVY